MHNNDYNNDMHINDNSRLMQPLLVYKIIQWK